MLVCTINTMDRIFHHTNSTVVLDHDAAKKRKPSLEQAPSKVYYAPLSMNLLGLVPSSLARTAAYNGVVGGLDCHRVLDSSISLP